MNTFKVGDRVLTPTWGVGTIVQIDGDDDDVMPYMVRFDQRIAARHASWATWYEADALRPVNPSMSPEAKMLWHAMRAGAKRAPTARFVLGKRKRDYVLLAEGSKFEMILTVYGDVPERGDRPTEEPS